jgi:hypothetical protein
VAKNPRRVAFMPRALQSFQMIRHRSIPTHFLAALSMTRPTVFAAEPGFPARRA